MRAMWSSRYPPQSWRTQGQIELRCRTLRLSKPVASNPLAAGLMDGSRHTDGSRIATVSFDRAVKLWKPAVPQQPVTLSGHVDHLASLAFSPDGGYIASGRAQRRNSPAQLQFGHIGVRKAAVPWRLTDEEALSTSPTRSDTSSAVPPNTMGAL